MELKHPFMISSRLLPSISIKDAVISLDIGDNTPIGSRVTVRYFIDFPNNHTIMGEDFSVRYQTIEESFKSFFGFLAAFAEAVEYENRTLRKSDNINLFPESMKDWASKNFYEIQECICILEDDYNN